ncbi:unnamed protein product [Pelagomonas calceolata]|uniref:PH domain-containing protein n=1 Tax=Pelagomonas calceolata TaxID=35677 RepID=A0A8J2WR27_9STRA|nr:unnamed protein product [Pelagomonas calceolata]
MGRRDPLAANRAAPASRAAPKADKSSPASSRAGSPRGPPAVDPAKLKIENCRGPLKKTSKSRLSGRAWKKRWLRVRLDLKDNENYALTYHKKEHDDARMTLALAGCAVRELEGADGWRDFRVFDAHEAFELRASSTEERRAWIDSLRHVITIKRLLGEYGTGRADNATFVVEVRWGARRGALVVADPQKLRRPKCACWPHEVLAALGIGGDHPAAPWLRVTALQRAEDAFVFGPSLRADRLTPDASYEVVMADERASMLERLSEGDRDKVEAAVSRHGDPLRADRLAADFKARAQRRLKSIDRQFAAAQSKNAALRDAHAARVADDERRALAKVTAATVDGKIDHMDSLLIEASYLETSLDTERIPLF